MMLINRLKSTSFLILTLIFVVSSSFRGFSQSKEIGGGISSFNYTGDLVRTYNFANQTIGGHIFYSKTFKKGWSSKLMLAAGRIKGSDQGKSVDALSSARNYSFNEFNTEVSFQVQYEFLDFRNDRAIADFTPYIGFGAGFFLINRADKNATYSDIQLMLPLSIGIKYNFSPLWTIHFEFAGRKTFYDYLDNISEEEITDKRNSTFQFGNWNDNDWYYFAGLAISYTFWQVDCPVPLSK
jgi:hypothetical protein